MNSLTRPFWRSNWKFSSVLSKKEKNNILTQLMGFIFKLKQIHFIKIGCSVIWQQKHLMLQTYSHNESSVFWQAHLFYGTLFLWKYPHISFLWLVFLVLQVILISLLLCFLQFTHMQNHLLSYSINNILQFST